MPDLCSTIELHVQLSLTFIFELVFVHGEVI